MAQVHNAVAPDDESFAPQKTWHPYDYYWRPGMALRPAPPAFALTDHWQQFRRFLLSPWKTVADAPDETPLGRLYNDHRWQSDEFMDDVVRMFHRDGPSRGRKLFEAALENGIDSVANPPAELVRLFDKLDNPPARFSSARVEAGRRVWVSRSLLARSTQITMNFMNTALAPDTSSAVGETRLFERNLLRRNLENFVYLESVTAEKGLERHSYGFATTVRVGLMHAQANAALKIKRGRDTFDDSGTPISVAGLAQGYFAFGLIPLLYDHALGNPCTRADLEAATDFWGYITYIFGVPEHLIPETADEILDYVDSITASTGAPSAWAPKVGRLMMEVGNDTFSSLGPARPMFQTPMAVLVRHVIMPLILGHVTHMYGADLIRIGLEDSDYRDLDLEKWARVGGALSVAAVRAGRLHRVLRTLTGRHRAVPAVDPMFRALVTRYRAYAQRAQNMTDVGFTSHDRTPTESLTSHRGQR